MADSDVQQVAAVCGELRKLPYPLMHTKLYLGNLSATTTSNDLMDLFSAHGNVVEVNLPAARANGPRGFASVTMVTPEGARSATQALHGKEIGTHALTVSQVCPLQKPVGASSGSTASGF